MGSRVVLEVRYWNSGSLDRQILKSYLRKPKTDFRLSSHKRVRKRREKLKIERNNTILLGFTFSQHWL
jgi:hypothetical protein